MAQGVAPGPSCARAESSFAEDSEEEDEDNSVADTNNTSADFKEEEVEDVLELPLLPIEDLQVFTKFEK